MSEQNNLDLEETGGVDSVEKYKFEPIKGYPMLNWHGKRPFTSTQYYPAQKKEVYGEEVNGWINKIFWGDNLQVMSHLLKEYRGKVDLIYIDPPYDSKADYKKKIKLKSSNDVTNDLSAFEEKQYSDIWNNDEYLQFMYERLILMKELLSDNGKIFLHCDWHKSHFLRCIMDEIFGDGGSDAKGPGFKNEIIWHYKTFQGQTHGYFPRKHDSILFYSKSAHFDFNEIFDTELKDTIDAKRWAKYIDEEGNIFGSNMPAHDSRFQRYLNKWIKKEGRDPGPDDLVFQVKGQPVDDVWHLKGLDPKSKEKQDYPTQKPEELINRIIQAASKKGDVVFDCFMGSGTVQSVAMQSGRRFVGADINLGAIQTTTKRLLNVSGKMSSGLEFSDTENYTSFEVYNVNNYDVFRNPIEAKSVLLEALEIEPLSGSVYDGRKGEVMVKIMPINRIATREDLNGLLVSFPYKKFEQEQQNNPNKAVESIMLICMGHEPDLKAHLEKECGFKLEVEVVDILRDKSNIEFKRDSEAEVVILDDMLKVENFFPMNLLQKLSIQKESVNNWKELVESIIIDWNYDGSAMEPSIADNPGRDELVQGEYRIPEDAGTIKIKITDLLSESFEEVIKHG